MTDQSLREDIREWLNKVEEVSVYTIDEQTDEILKLFEKRIDSWVEWAKPKKDLPKEIDPKYYKAFNDGFNEALRLIKNIDLKEEKEEMLK